ncbi:hypothetical protein [Porphyromonas cangingivalis]|uniref:hypothetical protein n=1 Tax=Porphyromonas cangingivalis TaxID=36874 RepID=UPI0011BF855E|nr:hypothetical protein [Porphyromonas cangingivalis]
MKSNNVMRINSTKGDSLSKKAAEYAIVWLIIGIAIFVTDTTLNGTLSLENMSILFVYSSFVVFLLSSLKKKSFNKPLLLMHAFLCILLPIVF